MRDRKYFVLLMTLVIVMVLQSFARRDIVPPFVSDAVITLLGLAVLAVVFQGWRERAAAFAVGAVAIGATWSHYIEIPGEHDVLLSVTHDGLMVVFLGFAVAVILGNIFARAAITGDGVLGAVCGYLLAAMLSANAYAPTETPVPGSFSLSSPDCRS